MLKWWAWVAVMWIREVDDGNDGLEGVGCLGTGLPGNQSLTVELTSKRPPFTFASASPVESEDQGSYVCLGMVRDVGLSAVCRSKHMRDAIGSQLLVTPSTARSAIPWQLGKNMITTWSNHRETEVCDVLPSHLANTNRGLSSPIATISPSLLPSTR
jgi:hypothetical protein